MKISKKLSLILTVVLVSGLSILCIIVGLNMQRAMIDSMENHMKEAVNLRSEIIENYVQEAEGFLEAYAQSTEIIQATKNPVEEALQQAQDYTLRYAKTNPNLENIYLADAQSLVLASMLSPTLGKQLRQGDSLKELTSHVFAGNEVYNIGVIKSKSTDAQVLSMYYPIYDESGAPLGFAGMALTAEELLVKLEKLELFGLKESSCYILDAAKLCYISSADKAQNGTTIEDENMKKIIEDAKGTRDDTIYLEEYKDTQTGINNTAVCKYIPERDWVFLVQVPRRVLYENTTRLMMISIMISFVILVVGVVLLFVITSVVFRGVHNVTTEIRTIATLDIAENDRMKKYEGRKDEVGIMVEAAENLTKELRMIVGGLKQESSDLAEKSDRLSQLFCHCKETVGQVEQAVQDIANGATSQSVETQEASESVMKIGDMVEDLGKEAKGLHTSSNEMSEISSKVVTTLESLKEVNEKTEESVNEIYRQTNLTNDSVRKIQEAVSIIASIADETSLLSLNASIEAARAGEQGRGFAVVATQIKKLAEQSNESASQINEIITSLIQDSQAAVEIMEEVQQNVSVQSNHMANTLNAFDELRSRIQKSLTGINNISTKAEEMDHARANVVDLVMNLSAIAQESAASTQQTSASMTVMNDDMLEIADFSRSLAQMASSIDEKIAEFKM